VCTYPDCNLSDHLFESRATWLAHEKQCHRIEFFCNTPGHQAYTQQADLEIHLKRDHGIELSGSSAILNVFQRPLQSTGDLCHLCFLPTKNLERHVSRHLHQIALFAIPRADYYSGDESLNDNSNAAQGADSQNSEISSDVLEDPGQVPENKAVDDFSDSKVSVRQVEVPFTEEVTWDFVSNKFSHVLSELPPMVSQVVDIEDDDGFTQLARAINDQLEDAVEALLKKGAKV
jgi:hypothetical protein